MSIKARDEKGRIITGACRQDPKIRLLNNSSFDPQTECWVWQGLVARHGYGAIRVQRGKHIPWKKREHQILAHRYSYEIFNGSFPKHLCVLHHCDNRKCINPNHLFLGTRTDNAKDKASKGRAPHGENSSAAKLTEAQVKEIFFSPLNGRQLSEKFGVHRASICAIRNKRQWKHLTKDWDKEEIPLASSQT